MFVVAGFKGWFGGGKGGGGAAAAGSDAAAAATPDVAAGAGEDGEFDPDADDSEEDA
jgi:hypothetical protein